MCRSAQGPTCASAHNLLFVSKAKAFSIQQHLAEEKPPQAPHLRSGGDVRQAVKLLVHQHHRSLWLGKERHQSRRRGTSQEEVAPVKRRRHPSRRGVARGRPPLLVLRDAARRQRETLDKARDNQHLCQLHTSQCLHKQSCPKINLKHQQGQQHTSQCLSNVHRPESNLRLHHQLQQQRSKLALQPF